MLYVKNSAYFYKNIILFIDLVLSCLKYKIGKYWFY